MWHHHCFTFGYSCGQAPALHVKATVLMVMVIPVLNDGTEYISCSAPGLIHGRQAVSHSLKAPAEVAFYMIT